MPATSCPASARARLAGRPSRMLTSCSGDGPPKITATWLIESSLRVMVGQVVLVQDHVAGSEVVLYPRDGIFSRVDQYNGDVPVGGAALQGPPVGLAHDEQVGGGLGDRGCEGPVLVGLAGSQLDHAGGDDHPLAPVGGVPGECGEGSGRPGRVGVGGVGAE